MAQPESEYKDFLPRTCDLLKVVRKKIKKANYDCGEDCQHCPAIGIIGENPDTSGVEHPIENPFVARNLGIRRVIIYPGPGDPVDLPPEPPSD